MYSATAGTCPASKPPIRKRRAMIPAEFVVAACKMLAVPHPVAMRAVHSGRGTNVHTRTSCSVSSNLSKLIENTHPVEANVPNVQDGDNPRVVSRSDAPGLSHAGRVGISDIAPVD